MSNTATQKQPAPGLFQGLRSRRKAKFTTKEMVKMFRSLASMLKAQITTADALKYYAKGLPNKELATALESIRTDILNGLTAHEGFARTGLFDPMIVGLVQAGTDSARLDEAFAALAKSFETQAKFKKQLKSATIIPSIVITVLTGAFIVAMVKIVPQVEEMIMSVGQQPDTFSSLIFKLSHFVQAVWGPFVLLAITGVCMIAFSLKIRTVILNLLMSKWRLMRTMIMSLRQMTILSTAYLLNSNGINLAKAMRVAAQTVKNTPMYQEIITAADKYEHTGVPLGMALSKFTSCDEQVSHMITIGEKSSSVATQLNMLAGMYEEDADNYMKEFTTMISFLVTTLAALLIATVMIGTYLPIVLMGPKLMNSAR